MIRYWPLLFIAVPLIELYLIIKVGGLIGAFMTVMLVVFTAIVGVSLLRFQGFSTLRRAQVNMAHGQMPAMEMLEGMMLAIAGVLLLTPGFLTDTIGFILLIPAGRRAIIRSLLANTTIYGGGSGGPFGGPFGGTGGPRGGPGQHQGNSRDSTSRRDDSRPGRTLEGEFERKD